MSEYLIMSFVVAYLAAGDEAMNEASTLGRIALVFLLAFMFWPFFVVAGTVYGLLILCAMSARWLARHVAAPFR